MVVTNCTYVAVITLDKENIPQFKTNENINDYLFYNQDNINECYNGTLSELDFKYDYSILIGDNINTEINSNIVVDIINNHCLYEKPIAFAGKGPCDILSRFQHDIKHVNASKLEFTCEEWMNGVKYTIDYQNYTVKCDLSSVRNDINALQHTESLLVDVSNNVDEYSAFPGDTNNEYIKYDGILLSHKQSIESIESNKHFVSINNKDYFIAELHDLIRIACFKQYLDQDVENRKMSLTKKQIDYIIYSILGFKGNGREPVVLVSDEDMYVLEIGHLQSAIDIQKSEIGDGKNVFILNYYQKNPFLEEPEMDYMTMYLVNFKFNRSQLLSKQFKELISPSIFFRYNPFLTKIIQKYKKRIENIINKHHHKLQEINV